MSNTFFQRSKKIWGADILTSLGRGLKHAALVPHVAREGTLCGTSCLLGSSTKFIFTLLSLFTSFKSARLAIKSASSLEKPKTQFPITHYTFVENKM